MGQREGEGSKELLGGCKSPLRPSPQPTERVRFPIGNAALRLRWVLPGERVKVLEVERSRDLYGYLSVVSSCLKLSFSEWFW